MREQIYIILILISSYSLFSENLFQVTTNNEDIYTGYIIEDNPGEIIILRDELTKEIIALSYENIMVIRSIKEKDPIQNEVKSEELQETIPIKKLETIVELDLFPTSDIELGYSVKMLKDKIINLSLRDLNSIQLDRDLLSETPYSLKENVYIDIKKDDTLKYTLLNIIPGLGSFLQGDYYAGLYSLTSVLGGVLYNIGYNGTGTDLYFILNLNAALAYVSGFVAPLRYNMEYNNTVKDKLSL